MLLRFPPQLISSLLEDLIQEVVMRGKAVRFYILVVFIPVALIGLCFYSQQQRAETSSSPAIPKTWDEAALADWARPLAGLNLRPTSISAKEYYAMRIENLRTYPVYFPGREPQGYWEMLQRIGPQPLIEPSTLRTDADWLEAGRRVF